MILMQTSKPKKKFFLQKQQCFLQLNGLIWNDFLLLKSVLIFV